MEENFAHKATEMTRRFYLNPSHNGSVEFTKGGYLRMMHRNLGKVNGIIVGFEENSGGNGYNFHMNQDDGENLTVSLNNYGYYSVEGSEDKLGLLLLSTATEREEIDFGTVRIQNTFPEHGVFCCLNLNHQEFIDFLEENGQMNYAWLIDRQVLKGLFQLHDIVLIQFTMDNPTTGEFDAEMFCPGYKLELKYRHLSNELNVSLIDLNESVNWPGF